MFKSLSYETFSFFGTTSMKLWAIENELHYSKNVMTRPDETVEDAVSSLTVEAFEKKLEGLRITEWKKSYKLKDLMVLDGESWTVICEDAEHKKMKYSGENAYPANWRKFLNLLEDVVGDVSADALRYDDRW